MLKLSQASSFKFISLAVGCDPYGRVEESTEKLYLPEPVKPDRPWKHPLQYFNLENQPYKRKPVFNLPSKNYLK